MHRLNVLFVVLVASLSLVSAVNTVETEQNTLSAQDASQYTVFLSPSAHEILNCHAMQDAFVSEKDPKLVGTDFFKSLVPVLSNIPCELLGETGAFGAEVVQDAKGAIDAVKNAVTNAATKVGQGVQAAAQKVEQVVGAGVGAVENKLKTLFSFRATSRRSIGSGSTAGGDAKILPEQVSLIHGSREPDLPCDNRDGNLGHNCLMAVTPGGIEAKIEGLVDKIRGKTDAAIEDDMKNIESTHFTYAAAATHFGPLSVGHAQTAYRPGDTVLPGVYEALQNPSIMVQHYSDKFKPKPYTTQPPIPNPTQGNVAVLVADLVSHFFALALSAATTPSKTSLSDFMYHAGRIGHTVGDSFSCAHTVRANVGAGKKGDMTLMFFQDYGAQSGDLHSNNGDKLLGKPPFQNKLNLRGYQEASRHNRIIYRIMIRTAAAALSKGAYMPVNADWPTAGRPTDPMQQGMAEFRWYIVNRVLAFLSPYFQGYSAKGCVTLNTADPNADKQGRVCTWTATEQTAKGTATTTRKEVAAALGISEDEAEKTFGVCPDLKTPLKNAFSPRTGGSQSSSSMAYTAKKINVGK